MSDSYDDYCAKCDMAEALAEELEVFWIMKNGERIRYKDMEQAHLENAFNRLERICKKEGLTPHQWIAFEALSNEIKRRKNEA